jgi:CheY-like chemotaxis protein
MINLEGWSVLVVDDDRDNLRLLEDILLFSQANVTCVSSGQEALEKLAANRYRLILQDVQMPVVSGWDIIKFIRNHIDAEIKTQVVVAVTAQAMWGDKERILAAGFDGYISKPIDSLEFLTTIKDILDSKKGSQGQTHGT